MHTSSSPALTTAVRVIDRVHHNTTHRRTNSTPAIRPGLANGAEAMFFIPHFADRCPTLDMNAPNFPGTQTHLSVNSLTR
jgi:hypothetical protein